jgi:hypothetical protein
MLLAQCFSSNASRSTTKDKELQIIYKKTLVFGFGRLTKIKYATCGIHALRRLHNTLEICREGVSTAKKRLQILSQIQGNSQRQNHKILGVTTINLKFGFLKFNMMF